MIARSPTNDAGFSTVEALISFLILTMILAGTIQLLSTSLQMIKRTNEIDAFQHTLQDIKTTIVPRLLKDSAASASSLQQVVGGWKVSIEPVLDGTGAQTGGGAYGNLYHIKIESVAHNQAGHANSSQVFNSFRLVPQPRSE